MDNLTSKHYELVSGINFSKGNIVSMFNVFTIDILTSVRRNDIKKLNAILTTIELFRLDISRYFLNKELINMFKRNIENSIEYINNSSEFLIWEIMLKKEEKIDFIVLDIPRKLISEGRRLMIPKILKGSFVIDEEEYNEILDELRE